MRLADRHAGGLAAGESDDWRHRGLCVRNEDPEMWFAEPPAPAARQAVAICRRCPVQAQCLEWAIETRQRDGIWGGMDLTERAAHRANPTPEVLAHPAKDAVAELAKRGWSNPMIAAKLGCSTWTVRRIRRAMGLGGRPGRPRRVTVAEVMPRVRELAEMGVSDSYIGAVVGLNPATVGRARRAEGIPAGFNVRQGANA